MKINIKYNRPVWQIIKTHVYRISVIGYVSLPTGLNVHVFTLNPLIERKLDEVERTITPHVLVS